MTWAEKELERLTKMMYDPCEDMTEDDYETLNYIRCTNAESDWLDTQDESEAEMDWQSWEDLQEV